MSLRDKYTNEEWTELEDRIPSKSKKKTEYKRVFIKEDGDGHSYVVPNVLEQVFDNLLEEDEYDEFDTVFEKFRCSGDPMIKHEFYIKK